LDTLTGRVTIAEERRMSDESEEQRRIPPAADSTIPGERLDDTLADNADATRIPPAVEPDATRVAPPAEPDATRVVPAVESDGDATRVAPAALPDDDWATSRANPVWSGRAEVRSPRPGQASYDTDWSEAPLPAPVQRDRWWLPIVIGIIVLLLLGVLAWAIYVIVQNSGNETPAPGPTTTAATTNAPTTPASTAPPSTAPPSTEPTTTVATTGTAPVTSVTVPALKGLPLADARAALNRKNLRYRVLYLDSKAAPGTVIDSDPAEGQEVPPDTRITIVVAQPSGAATTPSTTAATGAGTATG
jgi:hypothetical protein